ncbi:MAG: hypothetical protein LBL04_14045 [Bacteroidales bacterium]|jgi:hypothetical protein|nr:hypothetical protein [Bacteroidales bacterium]
MTQTEVKQSVQFNSRMDRLRKGVLKSVFAAYEAAGIPCSIRLAKREACSRWANAGFNDLEKVELEWIYKKWCAIQKVISHHRREGIHMSDPIAYAVETVCNAARADSINDLTLGDLNRITHEWRKKKDVKDVREAQDYEHAIRARMN